MDGKYVHHPMVLTSGHPNELSAAHNLSHEPEVQRDPGMRHLRQRGPNRSDRPAADEPFLSHI